MDAPVIINWYIFQFISNIYILIHIGSGNGLAREATNSIMMRDPTAVVGIPKQNKLFIQKQHSGFLTVHKTSKYCCWPHYSVFLQHCSLSYHLFYWHLWIDWCKKVSGIHSACRDWDTMSISAWTHKRYSIPRPKGWGIRCLLWEIWRKCTAL